MMNISNVNAVKKIHRKLAEGKKKGQMVRWSLCLGMVVVLFLLFPGREAFEFGGFQVGMVSDQEVVAPFTFHVLKTEEKLQKQRQKAKEKVPPVLNYNQKIVTQVQGKIDSFFSLKTDQIKPPVSLEMLKSPRKLDSEEIARLKDFCENSLAEIYKVGIVDKKDRFGDLAVILKDGEEKKVNLDKVYDLAGAKEKIAEEAEDSFSDAKFARMGSNIATAFLKPNLYFDEKETMRRKEEKVKAVPIYERTIFKGTKIVDKQQVITKEDIQELKSLAKAKVQRGISMDIWSKIQLGLGRVLLSAFVILMFGNYLYTFRRDIYNNGSSLSLLAILSLIPAVVASYVARNADVSPYYIPIALSSLLITVLFNAELGLVFTLFVAFMVGSLLGYNFQVTFVLVLCGIVAVYSVKKVRHRYQFYRPMIYLPLAYAISIIVTNLLRFVPFEQTLHEVVSGVLTGFFSPVLTIGLLPVFESIFGVTTDVTLLELSDFNHPLLRRLARKAPGTYHHSITIGNLAEAAAEAIGANSLLARVSSYYHDIGKMEKPGYFIENQNSKNPHNKLAPSMSSLILASHVKEGHDMANKYKLPRPVKDIIKQHHGRSRMDWFYYRALARKDKEEVDEDKFRYPGPSPQTKEAAIVMLADSIEAAARSMKGEKTPSRLKGLIKEIIQSKLSEDELNQCNLTLKELDKIAQSFLHILMGTFHKRIEYTKEKKVNGDILQKGARSNGVRT